MKIAHLILTHKNPKQLERLIDALNYPGFDFYVHIDKKSDITPFEYLARKNNVIFIKNRTKIYWAGYGTIQATLNGFLEILPAKEYDYINVISGQDFPLKPAAYISQYFNDRNGSEFITCESIDDEWKEAAPRVRKYHLINWQIPGKFKLEKIINKILPARKFPVNYKIVGRANWFTLTPAACQYILDFLVLHPSYVRYFKYTWGGDEFFFATILYNSQFKDKIENNVVYVDWTGQKNGHPRILNSSDYENLLTTEKLFARKFDMDKDEKIFTLLEEKIKPAPSYK